MTFSYDLDEDIGKLRLEIGDTVIDIGVKPDETNFTDEELNYLLTEEGSIGRAAARACEILARMFAPLVDLAVGPQREKLGDVHDHWMEQAATLRAEHGGGSARTVSVGVIPKDGYSKAAPSDYVLDSQDSSSDYVS